MVSVRDELVYLHPGLGDQPMPYLRGWEIQRQLHEQRRNNQIPDTCVLLQHEPVFTAGKRTGPLDRPAGDAGAPVVEADRGGKITWHGAGQLVGVPDHPARGAGRRDRLRAGHRGSADPGLR